MNKILKILLFSLISDHILIKQFQQALLPLDHRVKTIKFVNSLILDGNPKIMITNTLDWTDPSLWIIKHEIENVSLFKR